MLVNPSLGSRGISILITYRNQLLNSCHTNSTLVSTITMKSVCHKANCTYTYTTETLSKQSLDCINSSTQVTRDEHYSYGFDMLVNPSLGSRGISILITYRNQLLNSCHTNSTLVSTITMKSVCHKANCTYTYTTETLSKQSSDCINSSTQVTRDEH